MLDLRDYQQAFVGKVHGAWDIVRAVLGVLPTGGGKTVCFSSVIHDHDGAAAAVVHRREIVGQISLALGKLEVKHRIVAPKDTVVRIRRKHLRELGRSYIDQTSAVGVVSVQTLTSKSSQNNEALQRWVRQVTLAVFDEGHHYVQKGLWAKAVEVFDRARLLFVTATPERADGLGLGARSDGFAETMVEGPTVAWLIEQGYLSPFKYLAPDSDLDISGIPVTATGDLNTKAMRARVVESHLVGDVVGHYRKFADGKRTIVFASDVATAEEMAEAFRAAGVEAAALSGETDPAVRERELDRFEAGGLSVLVNVDLFDEGFDVPGVDAVILARPTMSLGKYLQMVGRALRVVYGKGFDLSTAEGRRAAIAQGGKPHALVIDPVRNWERHGLPDWPRQWSLRGRERGTRGGSGPSPYKVCVACTQPHERFLLACPYCGHVPEPEGRATPEQVDGDLTLLDVDAMRALFDKMQRADMDDDEYAADQLARRIPAVGRRADMRRHQENKYRRKVLRELMAWWAGMQPERPQAEIQRRFYLRFGVDMATALTLKASETDALIERIGERFAEDMA